MEPTTTSGARAPELSAALATVLHARLAAWFDEHRRDLPWRRTDDPYAVWISEAMLQQTRVEVVIPYFERFLQRLPTIAALADADEEEVVALWSGLGYYRRARALRAAARRIVEEHAGVFPRKRADVLALPGIGPYTAGAVLSIAYGLPEPVVDGNVSRVLARLFALEEPLGTAASTRLLWETAGRLVPRAGAGLDAGTWNQALMELGALVCTGRSARCAACPLAQHCRARRDGRVDELPRSSARRAPIDVALEVLVATRGGEVLLVRRSNEGRMARMWELPTREVPEGGAPPRLWPPTHVGGLSAGPELGSVTHAITHHRIRARVHRIGVAVGPVGTRWIPAAVLGEMPLTGMTRKILARGFATVPGIDS